MHIIPAKLDKINNLQHFTYDAVRVLISTADLDLHCFRNLIPNFLLLVCKCYLANINLKQENKRFLCIHGIDDKCYIKVRFVIFGPCRITLNHY